MASDYKKEYKDLYQPKRMPAIVTVPATRVVAVHGDRGLVEASGSRLHLLTPDAGFAISEREVEVKELGGSPRHLTDIVLGVVRDGRLLRVDAPEVDALAAGDRLLYIRNAEVER